MTVSRLPHGLQIQIDRRIFLCFNYLFFLEF
jgi:hypothetical protein